MIIALHIRTDGSRELFEYDPRNGGLQALQERVGGYIEAAPVSDAEITMYCNEEGKIHGLPLNRDATDLMPVGVTDWIAGDVVVVGASDLEGYDTELPSRYRIGAFG